jgi:hypothetical protein
LLESWLLKPVVRQKDSSGSTRQKVAIWVKHQMLVLSAKTLQFDTNVANCQQKHLGKVPEQAKDLRRMLLMQNDISTFLSMQTLRLRCHRSPRLPGRFHSCPSMLRYLPGKLCPELILGFPLVQSPNSPMLHSLYSLSQATGKKGLASMLCLRHQIYG